jgi:hypothetical protein
LEIHLWDKKGLKWWGQFRSHPSIKGGGGGGKWLEAGVQCGGATSQLHPINHNKVVVISSNNPHANCSNCIILGQILFTCYMSYMCFNLFVQWVLATTSELILTSPCVCSCNGFYVSWEKDDVTFCKDWEGAILQSRAPLYLRWVSHLVPKGPTQVDLHIHVRSYYLVVGLNLT